VRRGGLPASRAQTPPQVWEPSPGSRAPGWWGGEGCLGQLRGAGLAQLRAEEVRKKYQKPKKRKGKKKTPGSTEI